MLDKVNCFGIVGWVVSGYVMDRKIKKIKNYH